MVSTMVGVGMIPTTHGILTVTMIRTTIMAPLLSTIITTTTTITAAITMDIATTSVPRWATRRVAVAATVLTETTEITEWQEVTATAKPTITTL